MNLRAHAIGSGFVEVRFFHRAGCPAQRQARCLPLHRFAGRAPAGGCRTRPSTAIIDKRNGCAMIISLFGEIRKELCVNL